MRGFGFKCDQCGTQAVVPGDPFLRNTGPMGFDPTPDGWHFIVSSDPAPGVASERLDLCSWRCVELTARSELVDLA